MANRHNENPRAWDRPRDDFGRFESQSGWGGEQEDRGNRDRGDRGGDQRSANRNWRPDYNYGGLYGDRGQQGSYSQQRDDYGRGDYGERGEDRNRNWRDEGRMQSGQREGYRDSGYREGGMRESGARGPFGQQGSYSGQGSYGDSWQDQNAGNMYQTDSITATRGNWSGGGMGMGGERNRSESQNRSRGQFAGRGPKGYQRADERIQEDVNEALSQDGDLDASEIEVKVSAGEVTLSGTVTDRNDKRRAEDIAERCSGVRDVHNQIRVQREGAREANSDSESHQSKSKSGAGKSQSETRAA